MSAFPLTSFLLVKFYPLEHPHPQHIRPLAAQNTDPIPLDVGLHLSLVVVREPGIQDSWLVQWLAAESRPAELDDCWMCQSTWLRSEEGEEVQS